MFDISNLLNIEPYSLNMVDKRNIYIQIFKDLVYYHYDKCEEYLNILNMLKFKEIRNIEDVPFFPVRLYKKFDLKSVPNDKIFKILMSSGTGGSGNSKIFLDRETSINQSKVLMKIVKSFIGEKRLPMLIVDSPSVVKDRKLYSARGAAIIGFSTFGIKPIYALTDDMELNYKDVYDFLEQNKNNKILIFGFTSVIWQKFIKKIDGKFNINIPNGVIIHGGGWKNLLKISVNDQVFKKDIKKCLGITMVHNYYGMAEQTGSIFMECEYGHLHSSIFSDVIIRNANDFSVCKNGDDGIVQLISVLPMSYPGHSILSEDVGSIKGEDDCKCGRLGKYFFIKGRIKEAEMRGCSDVNA